MPRLRPCISAVTWWCTVTQGTVKYYDLAEKYIDAKLLNSKPIADDFEHQKWHVLAGLEQSGCYGTSRRMHGLISTD